MECYRSPNVFLGVTKMQQSDSHRVWQTADAVVGQCRLAQPPTPVLGYWNTDDIGV